MLLLIYNKIYEKNIISIFYISNFEKISNFFEKITLVILSRAEKTIMRAMCGVKIIEKKRSQELMSLLV